MTKRASATPKADQPTDAPSRGFALLFPGQGSQRAAMGKRLAELSHAARQIFSQADEVLGERISRLCLEGSDKELEDTVNTQPAIMTTSLASLAYLRERLQGVGRRLRPSFMAGHSLGQCTAAVAANSLDVSEGLRLVQERGRIMAEWARRRPGGLAAVLGLNDRAVRQLCKDASDGETVGIAVVNAPDQTVISGDVGALQRAMALARERGGRALRLPVSVPGHSPLMREAARELSRVIATLRFRDPDPPLVSNVSAKLLTTADEVRDELGDQICAAVQWARCVVAMANEGVGSFAEVGPGNALSNLVRRIRGDAHVIGTDTASIEELLSLPELVYQPEPRVREERRSQRRDRVRAAR